MFTAYSAIVRLNDDKKITSVYFPDFNCQFNTSAFNEDLTLHENVRSALLAHITRLQHENVAIPVSKKLRLYPDMMLGKNDFWIKCYLDDNLSIGFFEKNLPRFGILSSFITAITMAVITFTTITVSSEGAGYVALGSIGAVGSMTMAVIMYFYSNASNISRLIGRKVDNLLSCKHSDAQMGVDNYTVDTAECHVNGEQQASNNVVNNLCKIGVTVIPVVTTAVTSLSHFKQVSSVGKKLDEHKLMSEEAFKIINVVMIIFSLYSTLLFQVSFLPPLYRSIDNVLDRLSDYISERRKGAGGYHYAALDHPPDDQADAMSTVRRLDS